MYDSMIVVVEDSEYIDKISMMNYKNTEYRVQTNALFLVRTEL